MANSANTAGEAEFSNGQALKGTSFPRPPPEGGRGRLGYWFALFKSKIILKKQRTVLRDKKNHELNWENVWKYTEQNATLKKRPSVWSGNKMNGPDLARGKLLNKRQLDACREKKPIICEISLWGANIHDKKIPQST